jgi:hypothetical protein
MYFCCCSFYICCCSLNIYENNTLCKYSMEDCSAIPDKTLEWLNAKISPFHFKTSYSSFHNDLYTIMNETCTNWRKEKKDICLFCDHDFCKRLLKVLLQHCIQLNNKMYGTDIIFFFFVHPPYHLWYVVALILYDSYILSKCVSNIKQFDIERNKIYINSLKFVICIKQVFFDIANCNINYMIRYVNNMLFSHFLNLCTSLKGMPLKRYSFFNCKISF